MVDDHGHDCVLCSVLADMGGRIGLHTCLRGIGGKAGECHLTSEAFQNLNDERGWKVTV